MNKNNTKKGIIACGMVILLIILDYITKAMAVSGLQGKKPVVLMKNILEFQYLENTGAAFGVLSDKIFLFVIVTMIVLAFIVVIYLRIVDSKKFLPLRICLIGIFAGAVGNLIDRIRLHYVIDFIYFKLIDFPIFNVADIYVTLSCAGIIILFLFIYKEEDLDFLFGKESRHE